MAKNIVVCCDGTGNEYGPNNTNVVLTYQVAQNDPSQITFYDPGVGTGGWEYNESTGGLAALGDKATGKGLQKNVEDAYRFLMNRYQAGDQIYLFGFSRGAFTVRSLAGMLHKVGLLGPDDANLITFASKIYNTTDNTTVAQGFKSTFSRSCPVHFIGVWDTVASLVMTAGKRFHDHKLNPEVSFGAHAISIDERRKDFPVTLWDPPTTAAQKVEQVWFAGVHSDVGGWHDDRGLSNLALQWLLGRAIDRGLVVGSAAFAVHKGNPLGEFHESYKGFWYARRSRRRKIPEGAMIHRSVQQRMASLGRKYRPKLPTDFTYVD